MIHIAIFASGGGSNARVLLEYFKDHETIKIAALFTNNPESGVILMGKKFRIPCAVFNKSDFQRKEIMNQYFDLYSIDFIALAGFLWLIPPYILERFENRVVNIHPSLLPKYGGKGMYGMKVHEAVKRAGDTTTGCTIHVVNPEYDKGEILCQKSTPITSDLDPDEIASKVLALEHAHYAPTIENYIANIFSKINQI